MQLRVAVSPRRAAGAALLLVAALGVAACTRPVAPGPIVLVVVDTLRADHLPCYGYGRSTAPAFCRLLDDGVLFERAYTPRTETTPAIASMFTGLYPHRHGVRWLYLVLPDAMTTLPELLGGAGFATGGFVSSFVMVRDFSGFAQGFDIYDDDVRTKEPFRDNYERAAPDTMPRALRWLRGVRPHSFLFVHLIDPHGPYMPPSPYLQQFAQPAEGPPANDVPGYQRIPGLRTVREYIGRYDGEIALADEQIGELVGALRQAGWYDRATIILTADHGECFGEEGHWFTHGRTVDDGEAHVPMIVKFAAGAAPRPRGARVREPVSLVDIFPTVLAAAGVPAPRGALPSGTDLRVTAQGAVRPPPAPITERLEGNTVTIAAHGSACDARWTIPPGEAGASTATTAASWRARAVPLNAAPDSAACRESLAEGITPLIGDLLTYRLAVDVVNRGAAVTPDGSRTRFITQRTAAGPPLTEAEREALRRLGYLEDPKAPSPAAAPSGGAVPP